MFELSAVSMTVVSTRLPSSSYVKTRSSSEFRWPPCAGSAKKSPVLVSAGAPVDHGMEDPPRPRAALLRGDRLLLDRQRIGRGPGLRRRRLADSPAPSLQVVRLRGAVLGHLLDGLD